MFPDFLVWYVELVLEVRPNNSVILCVQCMCVHKKICNFNHPPRFKCMTFTRPVLKHILTSLVTARKYPLKMSILLSCFRINYYFKELVIQC